MSEEESLTPQEAKEEGETKKPETSVWIVDDNAEHINSLMRALKYEAPEGVGFTHFQEGEQAVGQFEQLAQENGAMPSLILMDYKLDDRVENPKYRTGVEVIEELKRIAAEHEIPLPEIAAFSSEQLYTDQLLQAGASTSLSKMDYMAVVKYLQEMVKESTNQ